MLCDFSACCVIFGRIPKTAKSYLGGALRVHRLRAKISGTLFDFGDLALAEWKIGNDRPDASRDPTVERQCEAGLESGHDQSAPRQPSHGFCRPGRRGVRIGDLVPSSPGPALQNCGKERAENVHGQRPERTLTKRPQKCAFGPL